MFLKLSIDNDKVASCLWKEPYRSLVETTDILHGRVGAINLEQLDALLSSLKAYWGYSKDKEFGRILQTYTVTAAYEL